MGRPRTIAVIVSPAINAGNSQPTVEKNGLSAMRTGYLRMVRTSLIPFERAMSTYGFLNSSIRFARVMRIVPAVPAVPTITTGIQRWPSKSTNFPQLQGAIAKR